MNNKKNPMMDDQIFKEVVTDLQQDPFYNFSVVFALTSIIPFLLFFYILIGKLFSFEILATNIGLLLFISIFISFNGYFLGYRAIKNILNRIIAYAIKIKHSEQLKSTLISTVTHDLRNPLFSLKYGLTEIIDSSAKGMGKEQRELPKDLQHVTDRMEHLTHNLLSFLRLSSATAALSVKKKICNINEIINKQAKEFEIILNKKEIELNKDTTNKELSANVDEEKIAEMVNNILGNAVKFVPEGGTINVKAYSEGENLRLEFIDNGPGMLPNEKEKIFSAFQTFDTKKRGTGLGLAITKNIVELHNGRIWVESQPAQGSKFIVLLPKDLENGSQDSDLL